MTADNHATTPSRFIIVLVMALTSFGIVTGAQAQDVVPLTPAQIIAKGGAQLKGSEVVQSTVGHTTYNMRLSAGNNMEKGAVVAIFYPDAKRRIFRAAGRKIEALWWMDGDQLCAEYKVERSGHVCGTSYRLGSSLYFCVNGAPSCEWQSRSVPGNPEGL